MSLYTIELTVVPESIISKNFPLMSIVFSADIFFSNEALHFLYGNDMIIKTSAGEQNFLLKTI